VEVLRATFRGRWIGKGGSVLLPYKNHDLAPFYFFLMELCKELLLYGQNLRPESYENKHKKSYSMGKKSVYGKKWKLTN
jgi:hypothetical protein